MYFIQRNIHGVIEMEIEEREKSDKNKHFH